MNLYSLLERVENFEKLATKKNNFSVAGCARGKVYNYQDAEPVFVKGETFLTGDSLPLKEITAKTNVNPKDQGILYLKEYT